MTFDELLDKYRANSLSERDKGSRFELLMKNFLLTYPEYREKFSDVWLWNEFPYRDELGTVDLGIDIVCKTVDGDFWAVQCKFYAETSIIDKPAVDTFLATSSKTFSGQKFSARLWISTSDNLTDNAEITLQNQTPPVTRIGMEELRNAAVDWEKLDAGLFGKEAVNNLRTPLEHQLNAINAAQNHFKNHNRGKLIMACGTGKTYTSLKIAEKLFPNGKILFLVPSISLLGQILHEWATYAENPFNYICVCSDETVSKKTDDEILSVNLPMPATTNPDEIIRRLENFSDAMTVIFSTYQSLDKVSDAQIDFDLIICDEAHRTTGYGKDSTHFTQVHDENFIHGKKRLYMTATPRLYTSEAKKKAADNDLMLWSMDDATIYGEEFFHIGFGEAVEKNLLSDYKVLILTVNQPLEVDDKKISTDDKVKVTGCINALQKKSIDIEILGDPAPMKTAVGFCSRINDSERIAKEFVEQGISAVHVDGKMKSDFRRKQLDWLKNTPENDCRIITNARCLSEGVDVPSLDAILFLSSKRSQVDIVQAVGRVMRKAPDKKYGYIIIPVVVPLDKSPEEALAKGEFDIVWKILNALRAHDSRMDIVIEEIKLHGGKTRGKGGGTIFVDHSGEIPLQTLLNFDKLKDLIYARMVERVGNRRYWEQWAKDIAQIAERHIQRINDLIKNDSAVRNIFNAFIYNINQNLNTVVGSNTAIEMLAHHLIARPVFEALFEDYSFVKNNPVSQSLEKILTVLDSKNISADSEQLQKFYNSVRERCKIANNAEDKQKIIIELYDKFFRIALPKTVEKLGIVYTPVEVVDFILRAVNDVLKENFNRSLSDKNVHVLDPFTGTGTFIARLIQSNLIRQKDLLRKYQHELHANEIVLLAYYIAAVNIENSFHDAARTDNYLPFNGICLTDTFQAYEQDENAKGQIVDKNFRDPIEVNSARVNEQLQTRIEIIVGNPPYSVGQKSANDNNQNQSYSKLEDRIAATYAAKTSATNKNSLYDSYIKAFRWASDRISAGGVIGFVTNAGWLDGAAMDGLRKCFAEEFSKIYVFNLRGNARTQGEIRRRESGNVFGGGSRAPIAITILVKNPAHVGKAQIFYKVVEDYLTREDKLNAIRLVRSLNDEFAPLTPNDRGDWINQRGDEFDKFIPLAPDKKFDGAAQSFFVVNSKGMETGRDAWCYNFSRTELEKNIRTTIDFYNSHEPTDFDDEKIIWTRATVNNKNRGQEIVFDNRQIVEGFYRPFFKQKIYRDKLMISYPSQMPNCFPTGDEENLLICLPGNGLTKNFSVIMTNKITDVQFQFNGQCFPLYYYEQSVQGSLFGDNLTRRDGISDYILNRAKLLHGIDVKREDIFYYVYGFLHLRSYREKFSAELKKSLPRIILTVESKKFWELSRAGRELAEIHLNYESQPPAEVQLEIRNEELGIKVFHVDKLRLSKDKTTLYYNEHITIKNIPPRSFEYVVNGRSPLEWIIDRYQIKTDTASGIVNDPNDWATEHDNPRYILDLILSSITVSLKTLAIVDSLPDVLANHDDV